MGLAPAELTLLCALVLGAAVLYSSVGHAGASGYLAAMALFGVAPPVMKPAALAMNVLVAAIATARFRAAGHFRAALFWPFAAGSIPLAFVGGYIRLPLGSYQLLVAALLIGSALWMAWARRAVEGVIRPPATAVAAALGAAIGLLSGLTGVGGGIFLSPLLLFAGWAGQRETAAASAPFILVNSVAGLLGHVAGVRSLPAEVGLLALVAASGGALGSWFGATRLPPRALRVVLAVVLALAGVKLAAFALAGR